MERDLGRHIVRSVFRAERELTDLLGVLKTSLNEEEYRSYARSVATAIDAINVHVLQKVLDGRPELTAEIEADLQRYERFL